MQPRFCVLMVHHSEAPWDDLSRALKGMGVTPSQARSCDEAGHLIHELEPEVVFSEAELPDGNWQSVLKLAEKEEVPTNVIVVAEHEDKELYVSAIERGAHDFIAPPITANDLCHILRFAMDNAHRRRLESADIPDA